MIYEIIDTRTGERAKAYELVQEPWAEKTRGCDWPAFAVDETGDVMLTDDCGNYDMVPEGRVEVRLVVDREKWKPCGAYVPNVVTNADHIRAMSDEELAMYFAGMADEDIYNDPGAWLAWLQNSYKGGKE